MTVVTFVDETTAGDRAASWHLEIFDERITLRELIRRRVFQEAAEHNASDAAQVFRGLVQPTGTERALNGFRMASHRRVDPQLQFARAEEAFSRNGFVVLVGDRQIEDLDAEIELALGVEVTFLKLVPLVGG